MCLNSSDTSYSAPALKDGSKFLLPKIAICSLKFFVYDDLSAFFSPLSEFRRCCEKRVGRGIERCLHGILDDSDDEADADDRMATSLEMLNKLQARRNQEQRTAGNAGSAGSGDRCVMLSTIAVGKSTSIPRVFAAASVMILIVIAAPSILIVAPRGIETE